MHPAKTYVLSIAGFDPSGGAGLAADLKTFEMHHVYGFGVCTAITYQNESEFDGLIWLDSQVIRSQLQSLFKKYSVGVVKIGLIKNLELLNDLVDMLLYFDASIQIIWDPILQASAGFCFHESVNVSMLERVLRKISLVVPNIPEALKLSGGSDALVASLLLNRFCHVYLKGGHQHDHADDLLFVDAAYTRIKGQRIEQGDKHGSGCVLSAAIAANVALGKSLEQACREAKVYVNRFLQSDPGLLGMHISDSYFKHT